MARASFTQSTMILAPPERVRHMLVALEEMDSFHPLIINIREDVPDTSSFGTPRRRFHISDRLRFGPIITTITYVATTTIAPDGHVDTEAFQQPGVYLHTIYYLRDEAGQTTVEEQCEIKAPWLLRGYVRRQAQNAHREMLAEMKRYLEAPTSS